MTPEEQQLKRIQDKLQALVKQCQLLQNQNEQLKHQLKESIANQENQAVKIEQLEEKLAILKVTAGQLDELDKKELEKRLNRYLKEIDRCITILSE